MNADRKQIRKITGYTHGNTGTDPENWMTRACLFKEAADLIAAQNDYSPPLPFYFNAGLSIELGLKAIAVAKSKYFPKIHNLNELVGLSGIEITSDQEATLEILTEVIIWAGRYPVPKEEDNWDKYHDDILEKHKIRTRKDNIGSIFANRDRFPTLENYHRIWTLVLDAYKGHLRSGA